MRMTANGFNPDQHSHIATNAVGTTITPIASCTFGPP